MSGRAVRGDPGKEDRAATGIPVVPVMDGFRAYAILAIVLFHLAYYTSELSSPASRVLLWGTLPNLVDALFIVSGFVVFLPTVARGRFGRVREYALRRGARLFPAYWLALVVVLALVPLWPIPLRGGPPSIAEVGAHLVMLQMPALLVDSRFVIGFGLDGPLWTLSVELTFYLLLPLVAGAYLRRPLLGLAIAALVTVGWKLAIIFLDDVARFVGLEPGQGQLGLARLAADGQFPAWAFSFALGMTGAWAFVRLRERPDTKALARWAVAAQVVALVGLACAAYVIGRGALVNDSVIAHSLARRDPVVSMVFSASLAVFMVATAFAHRALQWPFGAPVVRSLGDISYGIYLIHLPVILLLVVLLSPVVGPAKVFVPVLVTALPLSVLYGWGSARLLEQPVRRWAQRFGRRSFDPEADGRPAARAAE